MVERPNVLYKYLNEEGAKLFLKTPQIRFTDWRKLDDLMEIVPGTRPMTEEEICELASFKHFATGQKVSVEKCRFFIHEINKLAGTMYWEREMRALLDEQPFLIFVCSMSARCSSGAMWALYAEEHRGIVFGLTSAIDRIRGPTAFLKPVIYDEHRPQMPTLVAIKDVLDEAIRTKSTDWSFQQEWRLFASTAVVEPLQIGEVTEIVIGYRADDKIRDAALAFKDSGTKVYRAYPDPQMHSIAREEI